MTKRSPDRLKDLRKQAGLTQEELSQKIGVIRKTVSNWERGFTRISPDYAEQLANYFQVSIGYLLGVSDDKQGSNSDLSSWIAYKQKDR